MSIQLRADGAHWDQLSLVREADNATRAKIMEAGTAPDFDSLVGWEFSGINTVWIAGLVGIRKFIKGFYRGPARATGPEPFIQGYNIDVRQNGVGKPHLAKPNKDDPRRFGFYRVHAVQPGAKDGRYPNALLLDYSLGGNSFLDPSRLLRDYIVQVHPDEPDVLLGAAYGALLGIRIFVSYFVLHRLNEHRFEG